jgi:hypothetical protein
MWIFNGMVVMRKMERRNIRKRRRRWMGTRMRMRIRIMAMTLGRWARVRWYIYMRRMVIPR